MLQNEYLDAKIGVDTAENGPYQRTFIEGGAPRAAAVWPRAPAKLVARAQEHRPDLHAVRFAPRRYGGSLSAVSPPSFATKNSFFRVFRILQEFRIVVSFET